MRRIAAVWAVCSLLLIGSFGVLMIVDRRAGIALPYSIPLAFAITLLAASALFASAIGRRSTSRARPYRPATASAAPR